MTTIYIHNLKLTASTQYRSILTGAKSTTGIDQSGQRVNSGIYLLKLETGNHVKTRIMLLLK